jgi:hypothetical protein
MLRFYRPGRCDGVLPSISADPDGCETRYGISIGDNITNMVKHLNFAVQTADADRITAY